MILATSVGVQVRHRWILKEASLEIRGGCLTAICGPNGAGKSTLLSVLNGQTVPTVGAVQFDGEDLRRLTPTNLAKKRAILPQSVSVAFPYSVQTIVELGRLPWGDAQTPDGARVVACALDEVGATHLAARQFNTLSGGEQQRVQLARVLAQAWLEGRDDAPIGRSSGALFLDEPTASLDPKYQHETLAIARRWADGGEAVVVVVHDLNLAAQYADGVVLLRDGEVIAQGTTRAMLSVDRLKQVFDVDVVELSDSTLEHPVFVTRAP